MITVGADSSARLWNIADDKPAILVDDFATGVSDVAWNPTRSQLAACGLDGTIRVFDTDCKPVKTLGGNGPGSLFTLVYSPDGNYLVSAGAARSWTFWNVDQGKADRTVDGHNHIVCRAGLNPAGSRLATIDISGELFVWENGGKPLHHRQLPARAAYSLAYSPDGKELAVATADSRLILLAVPSEAQ